MAAPKKDTRKITVNDSEYNWIATGNDEVISLHIEKSGVKGQVLGTAFKYHHNVIPHFKKDGSISSWSMKQRFAVTAGIVRQIIEYGLLNGWKPDESAIPFGIWDADNLIELNLLPEIKYPDLAGGQVTLNFADLKSGRTLNRYKTDEIWKYGIYFVFDSLEEAKKYAYKSVAANPQIECWIKTGSEKAIYYISVNEENSFE